MMLKNVEYMLDGLIHALRFGCLPILEICLQSMNLGPAVQNLEKCISPKPDRNIPRQILICIKGFVNAGMKKRHFR